MKRPAAALLLLLSAAIAARGEEAPASSLGKTQDQLRGTQDSMEASAERRKAIQVEIDAIRGDHAKLTGSLIESTRRVGEDEQKVADAQARLDLLGAREKAAAQSLQGRRALIAEVLAALQRMGRKPPPALLADPDDILKAIRTSMLLGAVLPGMRAETAALVADLTELTRLRQSLDAERLALAGDLAGIEVERERLAALIEARQAALGRAETALAAERDRAEALAGQASSLKDLIGRMETASKPAAEAAEAARRTDEQRVAAMAVPSAPTQSVPAAKDPARLAPAVAFTTLKGTVPLPVTGAIVRGFGAPDGFGGAEKGVTIQTGSRAVVASPADGWIAYAGPYRSFGQLLIINGGSGYYIVLAGMERINVDLGQFILAGEPIAVMGDGSARSAAAVALGQAQPVLYVEFRKDGATIDPGPWWAKPEIQRVRG